MRYVWVVLLLAGCGQSVAAKQREADRCWLRYGTQRMDTCLIAEYGWDTTQAVRAALMRVKQEQDAGQ